MNQTKTIKTFIHGDKEIKLAIPVDIDIKYLDANNAAVLLFAIVQEQLKKLIGQLAIRPLKAAEETENK